MTTRFILLALTLAACSGDESSDKAVTETSDTATALTGPQ
jgi:hypothetical protein